jgi:DNA-binding LacI/PurR family transcriptional regulator
MAFHTLTTTLTQGFDFTAIVAANDLMAVGCLAACRKSGIVVPHQLAIAGCEDILMSSQVSPALTAISYPRMEIGLAATELLLSLIDGDNRKTPRLEGKLSVRASTVEP